MTSVRWWRSLWWAASQPTLTISMRFSSRIFIIARRRNELEIIVECCMMNFKPWPAIKMYILNLIMHQLLYQLSSMPFCSTAHTISLLPFNLMSFHILYLASEMANNEAVSMTKVMLNLPHPPHPHSLLSFYRTTNFQSICACVFALDMKIVCHTWGKISNCWS